MGRPYILRMRQSFGPRPCLGLQNKSLQVLCQVEHKYPALFVTQLALRLDWTFLKVLDQLRSQQYYHLECDSQVCILHRRFQYCRESFLRELREFRYVDKCSKSRYSWGRLWELILKAPKMIVLVARDPKAHPPGEHVCEGAQSDTKDVLKGKCQLIFTMNREGKQP